MSNFTSNTYQLKREILNFSKKISKNEKRPEKKFIADITYGILASNSCILTDIVDKLHEKSKKVNSVERLTKHLNNGVPDTVLTSYVDTIKNLAPSNPVIHIDDSDVIKSKGKKFEALGIVRDGSKSSDAKNIYSKGYTVTEACVITKDNHPISIFSEIHSSREKNFTSINSITFNAMERGAKLFEKATFVMDRGYDDNKMFLKLDELNRDYVIRIKKNRKLYYHNKWVSSTELCERRKGKIKMALFYKGKNHTAYISHVKVQITASKKDVYLVLVYGITKHPMMLITSKKIENKDDVILVAKNYFSRWKIEEYFRCKKQTYKFEAFRVRNLLAINALNFYITLCMTFLSQISKKSVTNAVKVAIIKSAASIKEKIFFYYYRIAKGIFSILSYAKEGVRLWFKTLRPKYKQLSFKLII